MTSEYYYTIALILTLINSILSAVNLRVMLSDRKKGIVTDYYRCDGAGQSKSYSHQSASDFSGAKSTFRVAILLLNESSLGSTLLSVNVEKRNGWFGVLGKSIVRDIQFDFSADMLPLSIDPRKSVFAIMKSVDYFGNTGATIVFRFSSGVVKVPIIAL